MGKLRRHMVSTIGRVSSVWETSISIGSVEEGGISLGLWLSISRSLSVVSIWVSISVASVSKTVSIRSGISVVSVVSISISLSLSLGNMDNSGRVGDVSSGSGVSSGKSGGGSWGNSGDSYRVSSVGGTVSGEGGVGIWISSIAVCVWGSITSIAVSSIEKSWIGLGLSLSMSSKTNHNSNFEHVVVMNALCTIPM